MEGLQLMKLPILRARWSEVPRLEKNYPCGMIICNMEFSWRAVAVLAGEIFMYVYVCVCVCVCVCMCACVCVSA